MSWHIRLEKIHTIASIVSLVAVPILIALVGWWIQSSISQESIKKDYVQIAINILANPQTEKEFELRRWATDVLSKNSNVPFSEKLRDELIVGKSLSMFAWAAFPEPPIELMESSGRANSAEAIKLQKLQNWIREQIEKNKEFDNKHSWLKPKGSIPYGPISHEVAKDLFNKNEK